QGVQAANPSTSDEEECPQHVPPNGTGGGEFAGARWSVRMQDQGGRILLNALKPCRSRRAGGVDDPGDEAFLKYVIQNLMRGGNRTTAVDVHGEKAIDTVVSSILDWCDRDN